MTKVVKVVKFRSQRFGKCAECGERARIFFYREADQPISQSLVDVEQGFCCKVCLENYLQAYAKEVKVG